MEEIKKSAIVQYFPVKCVAYIGTICSRRRREGGGRDRFDNNNNNIYQTNVSAWPRLIGLWLVQFFFFTKNHWLFCVNANKYSKCHANYRSFVFFFVVVHGSTENVQIYTRIYLCRIFRAQQKEFICFLQANIPIKLLYGSHIRV